MPIDDQSKIAFVYPGIAEVGLTESFAPELGFSCLEFPSKVTLLVRFGVIGFNGEDNYSLEIKIFMGDEDVTLPLQKHRNLFSYKPQWSDKGDYIAVMSVIESFTAKDPGCYRIEASLLFKEAKKDALWETIDVKSSYFMVSREWRDKIEP